MGPKNRTSYEYGPIERRDDEGWAVNGTLSVSLRLSSLFRRQRGRVDGSEKATDTSVARCISRAEEEEEP